MWNLWCKIFAIKEKFIINEAIDIVENFSTIVKTPE